MKLKGTIVRRFGSDINTDFIIPAHLLQESWDSAFFAEHAFEKFDPGFAEACRMNEHNIVVAEENFGCGSSREQAIYALKFNRVTAVIAKSFPDIFHRNGLNNGLPLLRTADTDGLNAGESIEIDLDTRAVLSSSGARISSLILDEGEIETVMRGGNLGLARKRLAERLTSAGVEGRCR